MGYYNGNGVVAGGGESYQTLRTFAILGGGSFKVSQKTVYETRRKSGVSLEQAKAEHESHDLHAIYGGTGAFAWIVFDANGTRKTPAYTQIGDSNLYELTITDETLTANFEGM